MRKYLQMASVIGVFGLLVFLRQSKGNDQPIVVGKNALSIPQSTSIPTPNSNSSMMTQPIQMPTMGIYKNGTFAGNVQDAFYGSVQVQITVSNGKITDVTFLQSPNDNRTSIFVNSQAMPLLKQEAITAQSAQVDIVSGASATSQAFQASLADALSKAK